MIRITWIQTPIYFFCLLLSSSGQTNLPAGIVDKPLRVEISAQSDGETYRIIPCGQTGMILFYKSIEADEENTIKWYFLFYDIHLQQIWVKGVPIINYLEFTNSFFANDTLSFLFSEERKNKVDGVNLQILRIILPSGEFILNNGKVSQHMVPAFFEVKNNYAIVGLNGTTSETGFVFLELASGVLNFYPLHDETPTVIEFASVNPADLSVTGIITRTVSKKTFDQELLRMTKDGVIHSRTLLNTYNLDRILTQIREISTGQDQGLILGTYAFQNIPGQKQNEFTESTGFFSSRIEQNTQKTLLFFNFLDLKNATILLDEQDILKLRKKSMKRSRPGEEYSLDASLLLHDIRQWKDQYFLIAELFYPQYHSESYTDYDFYGRPYTNSYTVFDGYRFTSALIVGFDQEGNFLWDNVMKIRNLISLDRTPKIATLFYGNELVLAYSADGRIASQIIKGDETVEKLSFSEIESFDRNDKIMVESKSCLIHWYDEFFLAYGFQEIKNVTREDQLKRIVFYCNKVRFQR